MMFRTRRRQLDRELQDYLDRETRDLIAAGMSPEAALIAARRKLGSELRIKEDTRAAWGWMWLERLLQDLRHEQYRLKRNPGVKARAKNGPHRVSRQGEHRGTVQRCVATL
jgi:hypothetical protein